MKNFLNKVREFFANISLDAIKEFFVKNWKYIAAGVAVVLLVVGLVIVVVNINKHKGNNDTEEFSISNFTLDEKFKEDAYPEVNELINNYYIAYAEGAMDTLETYATPISDTEKSYIGMCSQYIENYQNVKCYTKSGLTKDSYLVSASYDLKFYGIDTLAPGLDFFYVEKSTDGTYKINNLYSNYNRERVENEIDPNVYSVYVMYGQQEDVKVIREEVQGRYQEALNADPNLVNMLTTTFPTAVENWKQQVAEMEASNDADEPADDANEPADDANEPTDDANVEDTPEQTSPANDAVTDDTVNEQQTVTKVKVIGNSINVRKSADKSSESIGCVNSDETYTKLGESGDWTQIDYNGTSGYVKSEYVAVVTE